MYWVAKSAYFNYVYGDVYVLLQKFFPSMGFFIRKYCNGVYLFVNLTINYASGASLLETEFEFMNSLFVMICIYICFV